MSGEVFSQSSKKKVRPTKVEENKIPKVDLGKARIDTKDGATYLGDYLGKTEDGHTIKIINGDTLNLSQNLIMRARTPENAIVFEKGRYFPTTGLFAHFSVGANGGFSGGGSLMDIGLGYRLSKRVELTAGVGIFGTFLFISRQINNWGEYKTFIPTYVGANYNLTQKRVRIFASAKAGYSSSQFDDFNEFTWGPTSFTTSGGAYFEPGVGLSFASKRLGRLNISITQILQHTKLDINAIDRFDNLVTGKGKIWISRLGFRVTTTLF